MPRAERTVRAEALDENGVVRRGQLDGEAVELADDRVDLPKLALAQARHDEAAPRIVLEQSLGLELDQGFAHRCAARADVLAQGHFAHRVPRRKARAQDALEDGVSDRATAGRRLDAGRHGQIVYNPWRASRRIRVRANLVSSTPDTGSRRNRCNQSAFGGTKQRGPGGGRGLHKEVSP